MAFFGFTQEPPFLSHLNYGLGEVFFGHHFECAAEGQLDSVDLVISGVGGTPKAPFEIGGHPEVTVGWVCLLKSSYGNLGCPRWKGCCWHPQWSFDFLCKKWQNSRPLELSSIQKPMSGQETKQAFAILH